MGSAVKYAAFLLSFALLAGCFSTDDERIDGEKQETDGAATSDEQESEKETPMSGEKTPLVFDWSPPEDVSDHVYLYNITAGAGNECRYKTRGEGDAYSTETHLYNHGIGFKGSLEQVWLRASVIRSDRVSLQYGTANTKYVVDEVRKIESNIFFNTWAQGGEFRVAENETSGFVELSMGSIYHEDVLPAFKVECDDHNALIRLWVADDFEPINSNAVEADTALHLDVPTGVKISIVENGRYKIITEGDLVLFDIGQSPEEGILNPYVEGDFLLKTPSGEEVIDYAHGEERSVFQRIWTEPGEYEVVLNRHAEGFRDLIGVLAGFRLEAELGDLKDEEAENGP